MSFSVQRAGVLLAVLVALAAFLAMQSAGATDPGSTVRVNTGVSPTPPPPPPYPDGWIWD
ncbi:hypothetical protein [Dactylosporangium salmoneum]|uniref:Uncharacterized protein n=1 Tax=Dactylosporangium salmoneum TaxID=53361 RepID=A0ABP5V398_9ACTN